jgi:hypothetical protein
MYFYLYEKFFNGRGPFSWNFWVEKQSHKKTKEKGKTKRRREGLTCVGKNININTKRGRHGYQTQL